MKTIDIISALNKLSSKKIALGSLTETPNSLSLGDTTIIEEGIHYKPINFSYNGRKYILAPNVANAISSYLKEYNYFDTLWFRLEACCFKATPFQILVRTDFDKEINESKSESTTAIFSSFIDPYFGKGPLLAVKNHDTSRFFLYEINGAIVKEGFPSLNSDEISCMRSVISGLSIEETAKSFCWSISKTKQMRSKILKTLMCKNFSQAMLVVEAFGIFDLTP